MLVDVKYSFSVYPEEVFGPVSVAVPLNAADGVKAAANDTPYGLAARIWTCNISKARLVASEMQAGTVWINCRNAFHTALSFGGYKQSGWGKEFGDGALVVYTRSKSVNIALQPLKL